MTHEKRFNVTSSQRFCKPQGFYGHLTVPGVWRDHLRKFGSDVNTNDGIQRRKGWKESVIFIMMPSRTSGPLSQTGPRIS